MEDKTHAIPQCNTVRARSESQEQTFKEETKRKRLLLFHTPQEGNYQEEDTLTNKLSVQNQSLLDKYSHLIGKQAQQGAAQFNKEQSFLILVQTKIDEQLDFLKQFRGKHRGEVLRNIRRNLVESAKIHIQLKHIRQLLSIDPHLYARTAVTCIWDAQLLIGLPMNSNLPLRRKMFQSKMRDYILSKSADCSVSNEVEIPQCAEGSAVVRVKDKRETRVEMPADRLNPLDVLTLRNAQFKERLFRLIREKEEKLTVERGLYIKSKKHNSQERGAFMLEVHLAFMATNVSSMFMATLLDMLARKLHHSTADMQILLAQLLQLCPDYIKKLNHPKGVILQINRLLFMSAHRDLVKGDNSQVILSEAVADTIGEPSLKQN